MKRDFELLRKMVLRIEDEPTAWAPRNMDFDGYTPSQVGYHAFLLIDSGLAQGSDVTCVGSEGREALISNLTFAGHDFADAARNDTLWNKTMSVVKQEGGTVTIKVLKALLERFAMSAMGLP